MIISYLKYRRKAQGKYHLHSPLVFELYENVLEKAYEIPRCARNDNVFYEELDERLKSFVNDNPLIFKSDDVVMIVKDIHRDKQNEADWERLKDDEKVRLSIDCWRFGIVFMMDRIKKEHYILKV
ncbi:MAG: hypothetical protein IKS65_06010 [Bacteroidales bacterium]|nr:hypothetical protein [Bacteroidales bacterium]